MKDHSECTRGFSQLSRAWYANANLRGEELVDSISIGFYCPEGGTTGEFTIEWFPLGGKITPQLKAFDDGWDALFQFVDLLEFMAGIDGQDISPNNMSDALVGLGIKDMTKEKQ